MTTPPKTIMTRREFLTTVAGTAASLSVFPDNLYAQNRPAAPTGLRIGTNPPPPSTPSGFSAAAASSSQVNLRWSASSGSVTSYLLEWSANGTSGWASVGTTAGTTLSHTGLTASTAYYYRISATGPGGTSGYATASATTQASGTTVSAPAAPSAVAFSAVTATSATITWTRNAINEDGHVVEVSLDGGFGWREATRTASGAATATVLTLLPGRTYIPRVRAFNVGGLSAPAIASTSFTTPLNPATAPATPTNTSALPASDTVMSIAFMLADDQETGVKVYTCATQNGSYTLATTTPARVGQCYLSGLTHSTTYWYQLAATNSLGDSARTAPFSGTTLAAGQVASPTGRNPQFVWTPQWQAAWNQALADYNANPSAPTTRGGQYYKQILTVANGAPGSSYAQWGLFQMLVFQITGNTSYATAALACLDYYSTAGAYQTVTGVTDSQHFTMNATTLSDYYAAGYNQFRCRFTSGVLNGRILSITSLASKSGGLVTLYAPASSAPSIGDTFVFCSAPFTGQGGFGAVNSLRDNFEEYVLMLDWLWPGLASANQLRVLYAVSCWADYGLGNTGGASPRSYPISLPSPYGACANDALTDNDQTQGTYFGLAMFDNSNLNPNAGTILSGTYRNYASPGWPVGGLTATAISNSSLRNAVERIACCQDGGETIDSGMYSSTLYYPTLGITSLYTALGVENFPRQRRVISDAARFQLQRWTSDFLRMWSWGDEQSPHVLWTPIPQTDAGQWAGACQHIASIGPAAAAHAYARFQQASSVEARFYLLQYPNTPTALVSTQPTSAYAPGIGHAIMRDGWGSTGSQFVADCNAYCTEDHSAWFMGSFDLDRDGEPVITHLEGDWAALVGTGSLDRGDGFPEAVNSMILGGMDKMFDVSGPTAVEPGTAGDYLFAQCSSYGNYAMGTYMPPTIYENEHTRSLLYLPDVTNHAIDTIVVYDRTMVANLRNLAGYPWNTTYSYRPQDSSLPALKQWNLNLRGTPTLNSGDTSWTTPGSQSVRCAHLLPAGFTRTVYNFSVLADCQNAWEVTPTGTIGESSNSYVSSEFVVTPYQLRVIPATAWPAGTAPVWDEFLNVIQVVGSSGTMPAAPATVASTGGLLRGTLLHRTGLNDALVLFGASPHGRVLHAGDTIGWTATASATDIYLFDLDPALSWSTTLDGGSSTVLTVSSQGVARLPAVAGSGSHTLGIFP